MLYQTSYAVAWIIDTYFWTTLYDQGKWIKKSAKEYLHFLHLQLDNDFYNNIEYLSTIAN